MTTGDQDPVFHEPTDDDFDINGFARMYGDHMGIPQDDGEDDSVYRSRVAGVLRGEGRIIEAHEVQSGMRYDDPRQGETGAMTGIIGAMAQALNGRDYSPHNPEAQVGDDIATGLYVNLVTPQDSAVRAIFDAFGIEGGMDVIQSKLDADDPTK